VINNKNGNYMADNQGTVRQTRVTRKPYFVGFNTVDQQIPPYTLTNIDLVKRDLSNHFATPIGSRVMLPLFGTRIYEYLFDPFDEYTKSLIIEDAILVVQSEPRVELVSVDIHQDDQALTVALVLLFKPESVTDSLFVSFSLQDKENF
jgi:phage baseplate assembly protein W